MQLLPQFCSKANAGNFKLKQFHQNYGFDLDKELSRLPVKELQNTQDQGRIMDSLQKGNRQAVTFVENGNEQRRYIEANPQFKTLTVFDAICKKWVIVSPKTSHSPAPKNRSRRFPKV